VAFPVKCSHEINVIASSFTNDMEGNGSCTSIFTSASMAINDDFNVLITNPNYLPIFNSLLIKFQETNP